MKRLILLCLLALCMNQAQALLAFFDYKTFYLPAEGTYAEFILSFDGQSLARKEINPGIFQASVEITLVVSKDGTIIDFRKTVASGPETPAAEKPDLLTLERFMLPPGNYSLEVLLKDLNDNAPESFHRFEQEIKINNISEGVFISDIEFVSAYSSTATVNAFSKSGYDLLPYISNYYPSQFDVLMFYTEIYNSDKVFGNDEPFVVSATIQKINGDPVTDTGRMKKVKSQAIVPVFQTLDISKLPSGEYICMLEVRDRNNNTIVAKAIGFTRSFVVPLEEPAIVSKSELEQTFVGKFADADSLYDIVRSHLPAASTLETRTIDGWLTLKNVDEMRSFLYTFWQRRNPASPENGFNDYMKKVKYAQEEFGTRIKKGWQTDRGRVYLQYGAPPTRIERHHNPDYYPFEIWHYYETNGLHNCKLLFYNPSLSGDFELIHTDNMPSEVRNNDWKRLVKTGLQDLPAGTGRETFNQRDTRSGDELEELWYNPH